MQSDCKKHLLMLFHGSIDFGGQISRTGTFLGIRFSLVRGLFLLLVFLFATSLFTAVRGGIGVSGIAVVHVIRGSSLGGRLAFLFFNFLLTGFFLLKFKRFVNFCEFIFLLFIKIAAHIIFRENIFHEIAKSSKFDTLKSFVCLRS